MSANAPAPKEMQVQVKKLIEEQGLPTVAKLLDMTDRSILRLAGGFAVRAGTVALVRERLAKLGPEPPKVES